MRPLADIEEVLEEFGIKYCEIRFTETQSLIFKKNSNGYEIDYTDRRLVYIARMKSDEIKSVIREIVTTLGEVKTKIGEKVAEYSDGCLMFWANCMDYIHYHYTLKNMEGLK